MVKYKWKKNFVNFRETVKDFDKKATYIVKEEFFERFSKKRTQSAIFKYMYIGRCKNCVK